MKKLISLMLALMLTLGLCACSNTAQTSTQTPTTIATEEVITSETTVGEITSETTVGEVTTETTVVETTITTESTVILDPVTPEELIEEYGIDLTYDYNSENKIFIITLNWTNKTEATASFANTYLLDAFQAETKLCSTDMTEDELAILTNEINPNESMTVDLRLNLTDETPVTVRVGDYNTSVYFITFVYDLSAVG